MQEKHPNTRKQTHVRTPNRVPVLRFSGFSGEWEEKRLGETGEIVTGTTPSTEKKEYYGGKIPWITPTDITENRDIHTSEKLLTEKGLKKGRKIPKGSLLVTCIASIGKNAILRIDGSCNQQINAIIPNAGNDVDFLYYLLERKRNVLIRFAGAGGMQMLNKKDFSNISFLFSSVSEQKKIAEFLGLVDEWIEMLRAQKKSLESYKKGVMQSLFASPAGGEVSSPRDGEVGALAQKKDDLSKTKIRFKDKNGNDFPEWEEKEFFEVFRTSSSRNHQIKNAEIYNEGSFPVVDQSPNIVSGYSEQKEKLFKDLPVIVFGDHTTVLKYIDFDFVIGADGTKILKNKIGVLKYLYYNLLFDNVSQEGYKRHFSILKRICLKFPVEEEQQKIAEFLSSIDEKISSISAKLASAQKFKKGLLQKMFV